MSVTVGISPRSDFTLQNAAHRLLVEIAYPRATDPDDRRILNASLWTHFLDLTRLEREQARRIAWLLDGAAAARIEEWRARGPEPGLAGPAQLEQLQSLLRETFGREPAAIPIEVEPEAGPSAADGAASVGVAIAIEPDDHVRAGVGEQSDGTVAPAPSPSAELENRSRV